MKFDSSLLQDVCWMHDKFLFVLFEECIYECMKFDFYEECMLKCMKFVWIWIYDFVFFKNTFMNAWNLIYFLLIFEECIYNAWNFVNFMKENACLNALIFFVLLILISFLKECIYECIKLYFFSFIIFGKCIWMNEIWFFLRM